MTRDWKYIHMMPDETAQAADDLRARALWACRTIRLAKHSWMNRYQRLAAASEGRAWRLLTPVQSSRCGSPIRRNHLTPGGAKRSVVSGEHMTISAQVIDTIVSGLMITCINRCVLMISLAMPGIRNGICSGCFTVQGEAWGAIFAKGSCCWPARDLRTDRVYDICLKYGFDSQQTFTRVFTGPSNQPPGAYRKENHSRAH